LPKVVVIEDNPAVANIYMTVLAAAGYDVALAMDARSGMHRIRAVRPDIVLLDLNLPDAPGTAVLKAIRADVGLSGLPVLVLTSSNRVADLLGAVSAGADDCAVKPCEPGALLYKVSHLLSRGRPKPILR